MDVVIIAPCFNENSVVIEFLTSLEEVIAPINLTFEVVIVNDASFDDTLEYLKEFKFTNEKVTLTILDLEFNQGHQGAILQGLLYVKDLECDTFIIMDSDGQDDPTVIKKLIEEAPADIVHVKRGKRQESLMFKFFYRMYRLLFLLLTGKSIAFGNYCRINKKVLNSTLFNGYVHFPSFLSKQNFNRRYLKADRNKRHGGHSKMRLSHLLQHALKSFIEYAEELLVICMKAFVILTIVLVIFALYVLYEKLFTEYAILGWASTIVLGLFNSILILISAFVSGTLLLKLSQRRKGQTVRKYYKKLQSE